MTTGVSLRYHDTQFGNTDELLAFSMDPDPGWTPPAEVGDLIVLLFTQDGGVVNGYPDYRAPGGDWLLLNNSDEGTEYETWLLVHTINAADISAGVVYFKTFAYHDSQMGLASVFVNADATSLIAAHVDANTQPPTNSSDTVPTNTVPREAMVVSFSFEYDPTASASPNTGVASTTPLAVGGFGSSGFVGLGRQYSFSVYLWGDSPAGTVGGGTLNWVDTYSVGARLTYLVTMMAKQTSPHATSGWSYWDNPPSGSGGGEVLIATL